MDRRFCTRQEWENCGMRKSFSCIPSMIDSQPLVTTVRCSTLLLVMFIQGKRIEERRGVTEEEVLKEVVDRL